VGPPEKVKTWGKSTQIRGEAGTVRPTDDALTLRGAETAAQSLSQGIGHRKTDRLPQTRACCGESFHSYAIRCVGSVICL
jgi:hypothetical protein